MLSREQQWAQVASRLIRRRESAAYRKEYGIQCLRLPAMIHECGLCQTLAFIESKAQANRDDGTAGREYFAVLLEDLAEALDIPRQVAANGLPPLSPGQNLAQKARTEGVIEYQLLSRNALHCANYLKRYAEAILKVQLGVDAEVKIVGEPA